MIVEVMIVLGRLVDGVTVTVTGASKGSASGVVCEIQDDKVAGRGVLVGICVA